MTEESLLLKLAGMYAHAGKTPLQFRKYQVQTPLHCIPHASHRSLTLTLHAGAVEGGQEAGCEAVPALPLTVCKLLKVDTLVFAQVHHPLGWKD